MKKRLIIKRCLGLLILAGVISIGFSQGNAATYDATGRWNYSTSNNWVDPGTAGCLPMDDAIGTVTVTQTGNDVTLVDDDGYTWTGTVTGADYALSTSFPEDGGTVTANLSFTLSSSTSGSGTFTWSWTDGTYWCNGGSDLSVTKKEDSDFSISGQIWYTHEPDGSLNTYIQIVIGTDFIGTLPDDIDTITVTGPSGALPYNKNDFQFRLPRHFLIFIDGAPEIGEYTFTVTSDSLTGTDTDTQTVVRTIPLPDKSTFSPTEGATLISKTPSFSWGPIDYIGIPIYYRLFIVDLQENLVFFSSPTEGMLSFTLPEGTLNPGQTYQYRVECRDSSSSDTLQNRSQSDLIPFTMASTLTHSAKPAIDFDQWGAVTSTTSSGTGLLCRIKVIDHDGVAYNGSSHAVNVSVPGGATHPLNFDSWESATSGSYSLYVDGVPQEGDYTFTVTDPDGNQGTAADTLEVAPLDPPDVNSFEPSLKDEHISASFDNVYVNGALYDDFDAYGSIGDLDPTKWQQPPADCASLENHAVKFTVTNPIGSQACPLVFTNPASINSISADITVHDATEGAVSAIPPRARIFGYFYNNGQVDVYAMVCVTSDNVYYSASADTEQLAHGDLMSVSPNQKVTASISWDGTTLTFGANGTTRDYTPTGAAYPPTNAHKRIEANITLAFLDTTPTFTWDPVANANRYWVRIYSSDNSRTIWNGVPGNQTSYTVPPGVLAPFDRYTYRIEAWDSPAPLDIDNVSKSPASNNDNFMFSTGEQSVDPFIDLDGTGVQIWNNDLAGTHLAFWIKVHDAQGVPGDIKSVTVQFPSFQTSGAEEVLYYDYSESPFRGIYRSGSFLPIESGIYTFRVEDKGGHIVTLPENLDPADPPIGYPAETSLTHTVIDGTAVDFDWDDVSGRAFYRVEIYDKDYRKVYDLPTTVSEYHLAAGLLKEETLYRYVITTRGEFFSENVDNASISPYDPSVGLTFATTPVTGGSFNPSIDLHDHGVATMQTTEPGSGNPMIHLEFEVKVTDLDGVPENIQSVSVTYPGDSKTVELSPIHVFGPTEVLYRGSEGYGNPGDILPGAYTFKVTDFDNNSAEITDDLVVNVLSVPTNCTPAQDSTVSGTTPTIDWDDVDGAARYRVRIYDGWDNTIHWSDYLTQSAYTVPAGVLEAGKVYSYRVYAYREEAPDQDIDNYSIDKFSPSERHHFTTEFAAPATISGLVSYAGTAGGTYYIGLFPSSAGEDWINQAPIKGVSSTDGSYTLTDLQPGSYFIASYRDTDGDQERDKDEPLGFYTDTADPADQNGLPLAIVLGAGDTTTIDFTIYDWPYFVEGEVVVDRENFHESGSFTVIPNSEVLHAEAEAGYRPGVDQITSVTVSGSNINGEAELRDDGIFPDDIAGDGEFSGWVETTDDPVGAGPYDFKVTANSLIVYDEDHYILGSSIDHPTVVAPGDYADGTPLLFDWNAPAVGDVAGYWLGIFDSADPTTEDDLLFWKDDITDTQYTLTDQDLQDFNFQLNEGSTYYWLVGAYDVGENNMGYSEYRSFTIDTTPPTSSATPAPGYYNADFNVTLTASEPGDITYTTDGSDPTDPANPNAITEPWPVTISITTEGTHIIRFFATDNAGRQETPSNTLQVTLDTTHPVTTPDLAEGTYGTAQTVALNVVEVNKDKTYYALLISPPDDPPAKPTTVYTTAIDLPVSGEVVDYYLVYYSVDLAANEEGVKVAHYTIDIRVPLTEFSFAQSVNEYNNAYYANHLLTLELSSPNNTIYYEWGEDAADDPTTESPHDEGTVSIPLPGGLGTETHYVVKFFAVGPGGLSEQIRTLHIHVDLVQPAAPAFDPQPTSPTNIATQTIGGTKEADTAIYREGVTDPIVALNPDITWSYDYALTEGTNQIVVFATDAAGNPSGNVEASIVLDTVKPYTSGHDPERNTTVPQPLNKPVTVHVEDAAVGVDVDSIKLNVNGIEYMKVDPAIDIDETDLNDMVVTFTPPELYQAETNVPVKVDAKDLAGNVMVQDAYTFLTNPNVAIEPTLIGLIPGDTYTFTATGGSPPYEWTSDKPATSTITKKTDTTAEFTASAVDEYTVTVTDAATDEAQATVDVINPIIITSTPFNDAMESGAINVFTATGGKVDGKVDWEASAGTIEPDGGTFTAPSVLTGKQTVTIIAYDKTYNSAHITPVKAEYTLTVFAPMSIAEQPPGYEEDNPATYPLLVLGELTILTAADDTRAYVWTVTDWNDTVVDTQDTGEATYTVDPDLLFAASYAGIYTVTLTDKDNPGFSAATLMVRVPMKFVAAKFAGEDVEDAGTYYDTQVTDTFTVQGGPTVSAYMYNALDLSGVEVVEENCGSFADDSPTDADNVFNFTQGIDEMISFRVKVTLDSTSANEDVQRLIEAELDELWSGIFTVVPLMPYSGKVVEVDGITPVPGAMVTATHDPFYADTTDADGLFDIPALPKTGATYEFLVTKPGYVDKMVTGDEILAGDIVLESLGEGGTIAGVITLTDDPAPYEAGTVSVQVKADGAYVEDGSGTIITVCADPTTGAYTFPVPADYADEITEYTVEARKSGYIFDADNGLGVLPGVMLSGDPLSAVGADLELKPVTIISVTGTPEDISVPNDGIYDQIVVKITAKAGPDVFDGTAGEIRVEDSAGTTITLDAFGSVEANTWSFTHDGYENFTITVYADVSEDTRDVDTGYRAEKVWHYVKSAALAGEEVKFNPNIDGFTVHFGTTTVYLPPGGLTGPIRNSVTISIVESEPEPGAASGMVEIVMTEESGDKCDNADIQRIEITMKFNPAVVTEGMLEDGTFVILQGDNMLRIAEGTGSGVPTSQIILPVDYVNGYVTFWVDQLSGFAVAAPPAGPAPAGGGGGGGCFIDTAGSWFHR